MLLSPPMASQFPPAGKHKLKIVARPFVTMWAYTDIFSQPHPRPYNFSATEKILQIILTFKI